MSAREPRRGAVTLRARLISQAATEREALQSTARGNPWCGRPTALTTMPAATRRRPPARRLARGEGPVRAPDRRGRQPRRQQPRLPLAAV